MPAAPAKARWPTRGHCRLDRHQPFAEQCSARGLRLAADSVFLLAHWTADRDLPRRFAVPFLVARMPEGKSPWPTSPSSSSPCGAPGRRTGAARGGQFFMIFPTIRTLQRLARFANTNAVLAALAHESSHCGPAAPRRACWRQGGALHGGEAPSANWPWSPRRPDRPPAGLAERGGPVPLLKNVQRLTAPTRA